MTTATVVFAIAGYFILVAFIVGIVWSGSKADYSRFNNGDD